MRSGAAGISVQGTQPCRHILNSKTKLGVPEKNEGDVASPGCRVIWEGQQVPFPPARESGERYKLPEWSGAVRPADRWLFYILIHPVGLFWLMRSNCCFCECWLCAHPSKGPWPFDSRGVVQGVLEGYINIRATVVTLELFHVGSCLLQYCRSFQQRTSCVACGGASTICPAPCQWRLEQPPRAFCLEATISPNLATPYALKNIVPAGMALSRAHTSDKSADVTKYCYY